MSWHLVSRRKPLPGLSVLVFDRANRNQFMAWWDGKRWWNWDPIADNSQRDRPLPFMPSHWRDVPNDPPKRRKATSARATRGSR